MLSCFVSMLYLLSRRGCVFCPPWLDLCGVSVAWRFGPSSARGAWLRQSAISAKGELLHPPQFSLVFPYICLIVYFETFYSSCIYFFLPYVGKSRREVEGELTHTPLVVHAGCSNGD